MTDIIAALKALGIADADIKTTNLSLYPQYGSGSTPKIVGYQISEQIQVTVRDLDKAGDVVDTATAKGAQKPPMSEKLPPFVGPPASGWPRVPLNEYCPFVLVPPPPAILDQVIEKFWLRVSLIEKHRINAARIGRGFASAFPKDGDRCEEALISAARRLGKPDCRKNIASVAAGIREVFKHALSPASHSQVAVFC